MGSYTQVCAVVMYLYTTLGNTSKARRPKLYVVQSKRRLEGRLLRCSGVLVSVL